VGWHVRNGTGSGTTAPLTATCAAEGPYAFLFVLAPLAVEGGTGSPANPLAVL
jgi:hypothetical protein